MFSCDKTPNPIETKGLNVPPPCSTPLLTLHLKASLSLTNYHTQLPQSKQLSHASVTDNSFCVQFLKSCLSGKFRLGDIGTVCPTCALSVQMSVLLCW